MDDRHTILWQLMQSLGYTQESHHQSEHMTAHPPFEHGLLALKPLMPPKQQLIIDLMVKMQELRVLMDEIHAHN